MNKNKIFNKIAKYTLVAMLALLPNVGWGETSVSKTVYLQDCKDSYGNEEGVGIVLDDIEDQLLAQGMLVKTSDGTKYDVSQKTLYLKITIKKKDDHSVQDATEFTVHRSGEYGYSPITTTNLQAWPGKAYKSSDAIYFYSGIYNNFLPAEIQFKLLQKSSQDLTQYYIEILASNETPTIENNLVTSDPVIALKMTYDIKSRPFVHYKGYANTDGDFEVIDASRNQLRQKVSKWEYTYVVDDADNKSVSLMLPIVNYENNGDALEPLGFFRWYNYDTDNASNNLTVEGTNNLLKPISDDYNSKGLVAYNLNTHAVKNTVGVTYTRPSDSDWAGENIACDVSRYIDGLDATGSYLEHEPTLSIRYIYHIMPSSQMANAIKDNLVNDNNGLTYEDNKNITVGFKDDNSKMTLRLDLSDPTMYYFYPMTNTAKHVYYPEGATDEESKQIVTKRKITSSDFGVDIKKASTVEWRAYNASRDKVCVLGEGNVPDFPRFYDVSISGLNQKDWTDLDGTTVSKPSFNPGDHFYIVAYAKDDEDHSCPIANFSCRYFRYYPKTLSEMGDEDITRRVSYLEDNFTNVATVSFDSDSPEQTLAAPIGADDNQSQHPSSWSKRSYGFVYKDLIDKSANKHGNSDPYYNTKHSPLHGEYGIYKTANVTGLSGNGAGGTDGYVWYTSKELHDRTYEMTNGSQSGSFLYVDASDESRTIASAEFSANLCTGQQMAFSAAVADMTEQSIKPQILFRLYGLEKDDAGSVKSKTLLHSFSSGDFMGTGNQAKWYQVYGKITLQKESGVENYSDFRIEIDNFSKGTLGADYAVDDIRIYTQPAKVQVYQDRPTCGTEETGNIKLKVRAIHETLNALLGHKDTKIHFRFVDENGEPVSGKGYYDYYLDGSDEENKVTCDDSYASVDVYDSESDCEKHTIDGMSMIEKDMDGERYIILANHNFPLKKGKKYYVSVCTDSNPKAADAKWGSPSDVCSIYSDWFELIGQSPAITDTDGKAIAEYRVDCSKTDYTVELKGVLTTIHPTTGEKVTLTDVPFYWYLDGLAENNCLNPSGPSNTIRISSEKIDFASHTIYMKPSGTANADGEMVYTDVNHVSYLLCTEAIPVTLRVMKDGPKLNFGFNDVDYPFKDADYQASLRVGLQQIKILQKQHNADDSKGYLLVPLHSASYKTDVTDKTLTFIDDNKLVAASQDIYVSASNDPTWNAEGANLLNNKVVATLKSKSIDEVGANGEQSTLDLAFCDDVLNATDETKSLFHEGYWYELRFVYEQRGESATTTNCPGESYLKLKIVPEYVTWRPTADNGMNANWNNDANWHRSSSSELYKDDYIEYNSYADNSVNAEAANKVNIATIDNYVPMKFTKVTVGNLKGLPFPDLGNVVYRQSNGIATKLTNGKGNEATSYIQYDIMAYWDESDTGKGLGKQAVWNGASYTVSDMVADHVGDMSCEKFYGNTCHQIYFKPQGELRDQCYLVYDKAWVEKELKPNTWYTMATPLQYIYAGDMYVPVTSDAKTNGRQTTEAFKDINFDDTKYSRSKYPVYQRAWEKSGVEEITPNGNYSASHYPEEVKTGDVDLAMGYWSHIYNKVDESYADNTSFNGFSIKAGNSLLQKNQSTNALLRLPKEDKSYKYYDYENNASSGSTDVNKSDGHGKLLVAYNNDEKHLAPMTQSLNAEGKSEFYLVANPYTCSISLKKFFEVNSGLAKQAWIVDEGVVKAIPSDEFNNNDFAIQPTQSFFVKKNDGSDVAGVKFTSAMYVDRLITSGLQMASDYAKTVSISTQNAKGLTSRARISLRPEASEGYDEQEDVDMLYDQNLQDIPQVYTVADGLAVAVNAVPAISWIPLGIVTDKAEGKEAVTLSIDGAGKLSEPLYLYDAADMSYTELHDGEAVNVEAGDHGRYFLTQTRGTTGIGRIDADEAQNLVKVYSPDAGMIVVSAVGGETLQQVNVFTMDGKMVHSYQLPGKQRMILRVPSGVYIVKAPTAKIASPRGMKITVR